MNKILIIQTAFLGDVVLATPLIERLHRCYPDAEIDFLLRKGNESLLNGHPHLHQVLVRDKRGDGKIKSLRKILKSVRARRYDLVVNLHRFLSSGIIAAFSGAKQTVGFDKNPLSWRYTHKFPHQFGSKENPIHEVDRNLSLIAHLTEGPSDPMRLYPSTEDEIRVNRTGKYYCIAPTSVWFSKQWPAEKWVALMDRLPDDADVLLLGAPGDVATCQAIADASKHGKVEVLAGKLSLLQSAALMRGAVMNYVNDSAPLHLASAMDAPVVAVFLSTVPEFGFGPRGSRGKVIETSEQLECRPCGLHGFKACPKGHFKCAEIEISGQLPVASE
jgi:heptosyltransferase-2